MDNLIISTQLLNKILGYLGKRPYEEVFQMIQDLQNEAANQPKKQDQPEG